MADVHEPQVRSYNMSKIQKDSSLEKMVRNFLHGRGFRFRKNIKFCNWEADIKLTKYKTIIDIRGCYFHRHKVCNPKLPATDTEKYRKKYNKNVENDKRKVSIWEEEGWNVIVVWGCELKKKNRIKTFENIIEQLKNANTNN